MDQLRRALQVFQFRRRATRFMPAMAAVLLVAVLSPWLFRSFAPRDSSEKSVMSVSSAAQPISVTSATPVTKSQLPAEALDLLTLHGEARTDFWMEVDILGAARKEGGVLQLDEGTRVFFRITSQRDCFVTILSYGPEAPIQLFPRHAFDRPEDARVEAGKPTVVPRDRSNLYAPISAIPSTGKEALCFIASTQPISLGTDAGGESFLVFRSPRNRSRLRSRLRGLIREPESPGRAISQLLIPYWVHGLQP